LFEEATPVSEPDHVGDSIARVVRLDLEVRPSF
jgi:hypothetical protein